MLDQYEKIFMCREMRNLKRILMKHMSYMVIMIY